MKFTVDKVEEYGNVTKITITTKIKGKDVTERFGFKNERISNDSWKESIRQWIERKEEETKVDAKKLEGKEFTV